ncbi:MAG TPA: amidohydrolase/deacetylase family metallohydrolase, partial [Agriterribacter sp.]|nr:amidohydrolase/deacetylase family metallohydrolase [Agriterribacter sp.]
MIRLSILLMVTLLDLLNTAGAQQFDMVIKGGHVIDPRNGINEPMDVAIRDGRIVIVAKDIATENALQIVHANGLYVTPGLIDIHTHVFYGNNPDQYL